MKSLCAWCSYCDGRNTHLHCSDRDGAFTLCAALTTGGLQDFKHDHFFSQLLLKRSTLSVCAVLFSFEFTLWIWPISFPGSLAGQFRLVFSLFQLTLSMFLKEQLLLRPVGIYFNPSFACRLLLLYSCHGLVRLDDLSCLVNLP